MTSVTRKDFAIRSELEVVHAPTGAVFRACPNSPPDAIIESVEAHWGPADTPRGTSDDYAYRIRSMAIQLLVEQVDRTARARLWGDAV